MIYVYQATHMSEFTVELHTVVVTIRLQCDLSCLPEMNLNTVLGGQSGIAMGYLRKSVLGTDNLETEKSKR